MQPSRRTRNLSSKPFCRLNAESKESETLRSMNGDSEQGEDDHSCSSLQSKESETLRSMNGDSEQGEDDHSCSSLQSKESETLRSMNGDSEQGEDDHSCYSLEAVKDIHPTGPSVLADFHQASPEVFDHNAAGSQCSTISTMAVIAAHVKSPREWNTEDLNEIVVQGDREHLRALESQGWPHIREETTLDLDEVPNVLDPEGAACVIHFTTAQFMINHLADKLTRSDLTNDDVTQVDMTPIDVAVLEENTAEDMSLSLSLDEMVPNDYTKKDENIELCDSTSQLVTNERSSWMRMSGDQKTNLILKASEEECASLTSDEKDHETEHEKFIKKTSRSLFSSQRQSDKFLPNPTSWNQSPGSTFEEIKEVDLSDICVPKDSGKRFVGTSAELDEQLDFKPTLIFDANNSKEASLTSVNEVSLTKENCSESSEQAHGSKKDDENSKKSKDRELIKIFVEHLKVGSIEAAIKVIEKQPDTLKANLILKASEEECASLTSDEKDHETEHEKFIKKTSRSLFSSQRQSDKFLPNPTSWNQSPGSTFEEIKEVDLSDICVPKDSGKRFVGTSAELDEQLDFKPTLIFDANNSKEASLTSVNEVSLTKENCSESSEQAHGSKKDDENSKKSKDRELITIFVEHLKVGSIEAAIKVMEKQPDILKAFVQKYLNHVYGIAFEELQIAKMKAELSLRGFDNIEFIAGDGYGQIQYEDQHLSTPEYVDILLRIECLGRFYAVQFKFSKNPSDLLNMVQKSDGKWANNPKYKNYPESLQHSNVVVVGPQDVMEEITSADVLKRFEQDKILCYKPGPQDVMEEITSADVLKRFEQDKILCYKPDKDLQILQQIVSSEDYKQYTDDKSELKKKRNEIKQDKVSVSKKLKNVEHMTKQGTCSKGIDKVKAEIKSLQTKVIEHENSKDLLSKKVGQSRQNIYNQIQKEINNNFRKPFIITALNAEGLSTDIQYAMDCLDSRPVDNT